MQVGLYYVDELILNPIAHLLELSVFLRSIVPNGMTQDALLSF
jgi:hypothetical protein